jgi:hypothetical protein
MWKLSGFHLLKFPKPSRRDSRRPNHQRIINFGTDRLRHPGAGTRFTRGAGFHAPNHHMVNIVGDTIYAWGSWTRFTPGLLKFPKPSQHESRRPDHQRIINFGTDRLRHPGSGTRVPRGRVFPRPGPTTVHFCRGHFGHPGLNLHLLPFNPDEILFRFYLFDRQKRIIVLFSG